ncbi:MAG: CBS domain-containing protein [Bacillota bacterium]
MLIAEIMTPQPVSISADAQVGQALELMRTHSVRHLPVITREGKLVGLLSETDILRLFPRKELNKYEANLLSRTPVRQIMKTDPHFIEPTATVEAAAHLFASCHLDCLPVVENQRLVGIITETDVFRIFATAFGFAEPGTRVTIAISPRKGFLASLVTALDRYNLRVEKLVVLSDEIVLKLAQEDKELVKRALSEAGFQVIHLTSDPLACPWT